MEKMELDLKEYEFKKNRLKKTYESLQSQADYVLTFGLQWKELEEQLNSIRDETQTRLKEQLEEQLSSIRNETQTRWEELHERERQLNAKELKMKSKANEFQEREKQLEAKELKLQSDINKWKGLYKMIEENRKEVIDTKNYLTSLHSEGTKLQKEMSDLKIEVQKLRVERLKEEEKLNEQKKSVVEVSKPLKSREELLRGIDLKLRDHSLRKKSMEELYERKDRELQLKDEQLSSKAEGLEELACNLKRKERELQLKGEQLSSKAEELEQLSCNLKREKRELHLKDKHLSSEAEELGLLNKWTLNELQKEAKQMEEESERLQLKENQLEVKSSTVEKMQQECKQQLEEKEKELEVTSNRMEQMHQEREKQLDTKQRQLEVKSETMEKLRQECKKHLEENERQLEVKSCTMEQMHREHKLQLEAKERQLEEQGKELELKKKQAGSQMKVNSEPLESTPAANNAIVSSSASDHSKINIRDARGLQLFMYEHLKRNESVTREVSTLLQQESVEPAKLVLEAMQGFYSSNSTMHNGEFDLVLFRRACVLLMQELKRISVLVSPQVKEEAMKLANDWKAKMTVGTESWLEVLGFLQLVSTYQLTSDYDAHELQGLLEIVKQHQQATELSQAFGTTDKAPASNITVASVTIEKAVSPRTTFSSPNHQPTAKNNIIVAPSTIRKRNGQRAAVVPPNIAAIQRLIQQKKLGKAYKSIRKFNLFKKFPPEKVLKEHIEKAMKCMENSKTKKMFHEQDQVMREGITDLRRAIDCIKFHNLKSLYTSESIEEQIRVLQKFMEDRRNENQKKRLCSTVDSNFQQHRHKFRCTSLSTDRTYGMHPDYPHPGSFYNGQFSIPSNNYPVQFSVPANRSFGLGYGNPGILGYGNPGILPNQL